MINEEAWWKLLNLHSYCPVMLFHSRNMEPRRSSIHKRTWKSIYDDSQDLTFQDFPTKDKFVSKHENDLQLLATDIYKSEPIILPELMNYISHFVERLYNLRDNYTLKWKQEYGVDILFPNSIKMVHFLSNLKSAISTWSTHHSPRSLWNKYAGSEGFI